MTQSSGVRLTTDSFSLASLDTAEKGELRSRNSNHVLQKGSSFCAAQNTEGGNGEVDGGGVIRPRDCDMLHREHRLSGIAFLD